MKIKVFVLYTLNYNHLPEVEKVTFSERIAKDWEFSSTWKSYEEFEADLNE